MRAILRGARRLLAKKCWQFEFLVPRLRPPIKTRCEHMQIIGTTGSGKTTLIEHMVRQDILNGRGVCVLDPHGR